MSLETFFAELEAVCRKHGIAISHEDGHGAFELVLFNEVDMAWMRAAKWRER